MLVNHGPPQQSSKEEYKHMKMRCYCKILRISYKDHVTDEEVHAKFQQAIGPHEDFLTCLLYTSPSPRDMTIPLQFASLYDHQEVSVWSNCLLDLGTNLLVGNMVFV